MTGYFITIEGVEGAGKTTVLELLTQNLVEKGYDVLKTREPGGIKIAEKIRHIILSPDHIEMDGRTEALLYAAARRQHLVEKVFPALEKGKVVLCDRFIDSSLAYQGHARELGMEDVLSINQFAIQEYMPDLTLFFDIEPKKGLNRITSNKDRERNRLDLEKIQFHEKVYEGYQQLVEYYADRMKVINADQSLDQVEHDAMIEIMKYLNEKSSD